MKKSKKKLALAIAACTLSLTLAFGGTLAYMTDTEGTTNTVTVGRVHIELEEPGYPGNDSDEVKNIIPNQEIVKDPQIENTGNNDALVFLRVEIPQEMFTDEDDGTGEQKKQDLFRLKGVSDQWELLRTETVTEEDGKAKTSYVYGYKKPLGKGTTTDKLFQKVQMKNAVESDLSGNVEDIIVTACAIQATDIPDVNLTPGSDGNLSKDVLDQIYTIFLNQSGNQTSRPADEGDRNQSGKLGKISYELDGGTLAEGSLTGYGSADYGYTPPKPSKKGYKFTGWEPSSIPADSTGNVTFTAGWEKRTEEAATLLDGTAINLKMKVMVGNSISDPSHPEYITQGVLTGILRSDSAPDSEIMKNSDYLISTGNSDNPVYMWPDDNEEVYKWWSEATQIEADSDLSYLCSGFEDLTDISGLAGWDTSQVTKMDGMFYRCNSITDLSPLTSWDIKNVTSVHDMFNECGSLTSLTPLKNWNPAKVTSMNAMFAGCYSLEDLTAISNWNTENVTDMGSLFYDCVAFSDPTALSNWNTKNVTDMNNMFTECAFTDLMSLAGWNTGKVTDMSHMFDGCESIGSLTPLANWNVGRVANMSDMFSMCDPLKNLDGLANWDVSNLTNVDRMFSECKNLSDLNALANWEVNNIKSMRGLFRSCYPLSDLSPLANWDIGNGTAIDAMFNDCTSLTNLSPLENWDIGNVTSMSLLFDGCTSLSDLSPLANWDVGNVTDIGCLFRGCTSLTNLSPLANWDIGNVTSMKALFRDCTSLSDLSPLTGWNTKNVTDMTELFNKCTSLSSLNGLEHWDTKSVTNMYLMFHGCTQLTDASAINDWDISNVTDFVGMFEGCSSHPEFTKRTGTWSKYGTFEPTT